MANHVCPWYMGYFLASSLRRLYQNPQKILGSYIRPGMNILEVGPGMGFFTLPMARLVGQSGRIICVDIQEKMLQNLKRRAVRANLLQRIETRVCSESSLQIQDLAQSIDFALAFAVVHEVPNQNSLLTEICHSLKKDSTFLISEPKGHVTKEKFEMVLSWTKNIGMKIVDTPVIRGSHSVLLRKSFAKNELSNV